MSTGQVAMAYVDHSAEDIVRPTHLVSRTILWLSVASSLATEGTVQTVSRHRPFGPRLQHQMDKARTFKTVKGKKNIF